MIINKMAKHKSSKELYWGVALSYITTFVSLGVSLLLTPIIIRLLGQSDYGLYETIGSFVNYLSVLDLGFGAVVTRYTAKYQQMGDVDSRDKFLYTCRNIYGALCVLVIIIGLILYSYIDKAFVNSFTEVELNRAKILYIIVLATTSLSIFSQIYKGILNGVQLFIWPRVIQLIKTVLGKIVSILILYLGATSVGFTAVILIFEIFATILLMYKAHKVVSFRRNRMPKKQLLEVFTFTGYLFILAIVSQVYWQIDKFVLGMFMGTISVAIYSAALNIENIIRNVSSSIKDVLIPKAIQISEKDIFSSSLTTDFMVKSSRIVFMVYGLLLVGITVLGEKFIYLWLGEDYVESYPLLLILGYAALLPCLLISGEELCKSFNKHGPLTIIYLLVSVFNIIFTVLLVKQFGLVGAAISTAIGLMIGNVIISLFYYKRVLNLHIMAYFRQTIFPILFIFIVVYIIGFLIDTYLFQGYSWINLLIEALIMCCIFFILMHYWGFSDYEKNIENRIIASIIKNK